MARHDIEYLDRRSFVAMLRGRRERCGEDPMSDLIVREYGLPSAPATVVALHGGPAASGDLAPLARELGKRWHVLEPFQRGSGAAPLTVATHVRDLDEVIRERCRHRRPVLLGHSWGAMLALAYAADCPAAPA